MGRIVIKVCGITEERDAVEASLLGVDAVGFHFFPGSPRRVDPDVARRVVERLPVFVTKVGVFMDQPLIEVLEISRRVGLTALQVQGSESPEYCAALRPLAWYRALPASDDSTTLALRSYACTTFLLRASPEGDSVDWRRVRGLSIYGRILIGGGLDEANVAEAIEQAEPYGVDVTSGVEFAPGKKDLDRLEAFVESVRRVEQEHRGKPGKRS